jgi:hypothetical protein
MSDDELTQVFWGLKVPANGKASLPLQDEAYTKVTNASLADITDPAPSVLKARVTTILLDQLDDATGEAPQRTEEIVLAVLRPNVTEQTKLDLVFSPLNTVEVRVIGPNDVHISGVYDRTEEDDDGEEEEEEAIPEVDEVELARQAVNVVSEKS